MDLEMSRNELTSTPPEVYASEHTTLQERDHVEPEILLRDRDGKPEPSQDADSLVRLPRRSSTWMSGSDVVPEGGYGWVCVACTAVINANSWGVNSAYAVFLAHYLSTSEFPHSTPLQYAFIGGLSISTSMLISPLVNLLIRRKGTHVTLLLGVFFQTVALLAASFTKSIWQLFLSQGVCFGCGLGLLSIGSVGIPSEWFFKRRSLVNGLATGGGGLGGLTYTLVAQSLISSVGLPWAFRILAILTCTLLTISSLLIRDRNRQIGVSLNMFTASLLRRPSFLLTLFWSAFSILGYTILLFSLPSYAASIGLTAKQGSVIAALLNLSQALCRPVIGLASDSYGRITTSSCLTLACSILCFVIWIPSASAPQGSNTAFGVLAFFALVTGGACGTFWATVAPVCAEVLGLKDLPSGLDMIWLGLVLPTTFAEPIGLALRSSSGSFLWCQVFTAVMYFAAALCLFTVREMKVRKIILSEVKARDGKEQQGRWRFLWKEGWGKAGRV